MKFITLASKEAVQITGTASSPAGPVSAATESKSTAVIHITYPDVTGSTHFPVTLNADSPNYQFPSQFLKTGITVITNVSPTTVHLAVQGKVEAQGSTEQNTTKRKQSTKVAEDEDDVAPPQQQKLAKANAAKSVDDAIKKVEKKEEKPKAASQVMKLPNGLQYSDQEHGRGPAVTKGTTVSIRYQGLFTNGQVFDSNMPKGQLLTFTVGRGEVVVGMDQGLLGMQIGGKRRMILPSQLGYGKAGAPPQIPPNATLIFDVELVKMSK